MRTVGDAELSEVQPEFSGTIGNAIRVPGEDDEPKYRPLTMSEIIAKIRSATGGWPRRVGESLFVNDPKAGGICWINKSAELFGWLGRQNGRICWRKGIGYVPKEEVFSEIQRTARQYDAIETMPHYPGVDGHFYACDIPEPGNGIHLKELLDLFNPLTPLDRRLLMAAAATPLWGGPPGRRPAFLFTAPRGRGRGKTATAEAIANIFGGWIAVDAQESITDIKTRVLTPSALPKRVVGLDNIKTMRFSWAGLESLITCDAISGRQMYTGDSRRPNYLTWFITLNGASLSTDMAQRVIEIQLGDVEYRDSWEEDVRTLIDGHREEILGDLIALLSRPKQPLTKRTRWATWEAEVLSRIENPNECQSAIISRRGDSDVEAEEAEIIEDFFQQKLLDLVYDPDVDSVFIPNDLALEWYRAAVGERHVTTTSMTRKMKQFTKEGRTKCLTPGRTPRQRGLEWTGPKYNPGEGTKHDIMARIDEHSQR